MTKYANISSCDHHRKFPSISCRCSQRLQYFNDRKCSFAQNAQNGVRKSRNGKSTDRPSSTKECDAEAKNLFIFSTSLQTSGRSFHYLFSSAFYNFIDATHLVEDTSSSKTKERQQQRILSLSRLICVAISSVHILLLSYIFSFQCA